MVNICEVGIPIARQGIMSPDEINKLQTNFRVVYLDYAKCGARIKPDPKHPE